MVFLHGAGISSWMWRRQIAAVPELDAVALDLPGHGRSVDVRWESVSATAARVADWIRVNATGGRAHVVGLSLGGVVGLELAARFPEVVTRLVTSGALASGLPGAGMLGWIMEASMPLARMPFMVQLTARTLGLPPEDTAALTTDINRMPSGFLRQALQAVATYRITPALLASPVPALVVAGSREYGGIRRTVRELGTKWPKAVGRIAPGSTHVWNWQHPDRFNEMVRSWLLEGRPSDWLQP